MEKFSSTQFPGARFVIPTDISVMFGGFGPVWTEDTDDDYNESVSSSYFTYGKELNNGYNGYEYAVSGLPSGSVDVGSSVTFHVFIGLDNAAGFGQYEQNNLEGSHFTLGVDITVSSDP